MNWPFDVTEGEMLDRVRVRAGQIRRRRAMTRVVAAGTLVVALAAAGSITFVGRHPSSHVIVNTPAQRPVNPTTTVATATTLPTAAPQTPGPGRAGGAATPGPGGLRATATSLAPAPAPIASASRPRVAHPILVATAADKESTGVAKFEPAIAMRSADITPDGQGGLTFIITVQDLAARPDASPMVFYYVWDFTYEGTQFNVSAWNGDQSTSQLNCSVGTGPTTNLSNPNVDGVCSFDNNVNQARLYLSAASFDHLITAAHAAHLPAKDPVRAGSVLSAFNVSASATGPTCMACATGLFASDAISPSKPVSYVVGT
jgi:hypothetical protein